MRQRILFEGACVFVVAFAAYGSNGPLQTTTSQDRRVDITSLLTADYTLPGFRMNGGDWQILETPDNLAGKAFALSGNGDVVCGLIHERDSYGPRDLLVRRAVAWRTPTVEEPHFSLLELSLLQGMECSSSSNVSQNGKYIIGICQDGPFGNPQACYWDEYGTVYSLGTMMYESFVAELTYPYSVSNNQIIVGTAASCEAGYQAAFLWDQSNGMRYIKDVLEADYGYDFSGCILSQAYNISPDGRIIDGYGYDEGGNRFDWVVTIPEPASVFLLAFGGVLLRRWKRTRWRTGYGGA